MDATLVQSYNNNHFLPPRISRTITMQNRRPRSQSIRSILADNSVKTPPSSITNQSVPTIYNDNWFDRLAINHLSNCLQASTGRRGVNQGYDGLVEAAMAAQRFSPIQQRQIILHTLEMAFPKPILSLIKTVLKPSTFAREYFAVFTTIFFAWLVGPCEVREAEIDGRKEKNVVHIPKCRFLEGTNCVGMCTNLCKMPSQAFIKESLGMPINMVPNFDDMSCDMIFGQEPPAESLDPAFTQPCYKQCKSFKRHNEDCSK